jgi:hypothetical protein
MNIGGFRRAYVVLVLPLAQGLGDASPWALGGALPSASRSACDRRAGERVRPPQRREATEVCIVGVHLTLVFDGERSELDVGGEITCVPARPEELERDLQMPRTREYEAHLRSIEPAGDPFDRLGDSKRLPEHLAIGLERKEPKDDGRGQGDFHGAFQEFFPPAPRLGVLVEVGELRLQEQVDVRDDHAGRPRRSFFTKPPSSSASASALKRVRSIPRRRPPTCGVTRYGRVVECGRGPSPCRIALFTTCVKGRRVRCRGAGGRAPRSTAFFAFVSQVERPELHYLKVGGLSFLVRQEKPGEGERDVD